MQLTVTYMAIPGMKFRDLKSYYKVRVDDIINAVAEATGITMKEMLSKCRDSELVEARFISMWLIKTMTHKTITEIGSLFNRHHTSIIHATRTLENLMETEPAMRSFVDSIRDRIR